MRTRGSLLAGLVLLANVGLPAAVGGGVDTAGFGPHVRGELIVGFRSDLTPGELEDFYNDTYKLYGVTLRDDLDGDRSDADPEEKLVSVPGDETLALIAVLEADERVVFVEPNYVVTASVVPTDPRFGEQWALDNTGQTGGTADADIDAVEAWDLSTGSATVIVGVIDTGVDYLHEDLAANMWVNPNEVPGNGIDDDANGYIDDIHGIDAVTDTGDPFDDNGHGTHVAGTIGAVANNTVGVSGVAQVVRIAACKFLDANGSGTTADAVKCFKYFNALNVAGHNVVVTNNSWGGGGFSQALKDAMAGVDQPGMAPILHATAAGNDNTNTDIVPNYPSSFDLGNIVAVAATNHDDLYGGFSNFGATTVDLAAPGVSILSTVPTGVCAECTVSGYKLLSGTSMATPHVTGAAAVLWSLNNTLTAATVKTHLLSTTDPITTTKPTLTNGRLNLLKAAQQVTPPPPQAPTITSTPVTSATVNQPYTYDAAATGTAPFTWSLVSPPTPPGGMAIDTGTGLVSWTPTATGDFPLIIRATNGVGFDDQSFMITVAASAPQTLSLQVTGGWNDAKNQVLGGDVTRVQQSDNVRLRVDKNSFVSFQFDQVVPLDATILATTLSIEHREDPGHNGAIVWKVGVGSLTNPTVLQSTVPALQTVDTTVVWDVSAVIDTPTKVNDLKFVFHNNSAKQRGRIDRVFVEVTFSTTPLPPTPPSITSTPVTTAEVGQPYSYQATASGSTPITWSLGSGPAGLTIGANSGLVTWTPTAAGNFPITIQATNATGSHLQAYSITVTSPSPTPTDTVNITRAEYTTSKAELRIRATSTSSTATLQVFVTASADLIGTLTHQGGGSYSGRLSWPADPVDITVLSSEGGSDSTPVKTK